VQAYPDHTKALQAWAVVTRDRSVLDASLSYLFDNEYEAKGKRDMDFGSH